MTDNTCFVVAYLIACLLHVHAPLISLVACLSHCLPAACASDSTVKTRAEERRDPYGSYSYLSTRNLPVSTSSSFATWLTYTPPAAAGILERLEKSDARLGKSDAQDMSSRMFIAIAGILEQTTACVV